jgi:endogenous inhibitor of DNA gyrase (YacG/DUF329 family)
MKSNLNSFKIDPATETQIYTRSCTQCSSGMNSGFLLDDSSPFCSKKCVQKYWNIDDNNIDSHIDSAIEDDGLYWTEWEELDISADIEWFAKDGTKGDIKSLTPILFQKSLQDEDGAFDTALSLLKTISTNDSTFPFSLASTNSENITFSNIIASLGSLPYKDTFVKDILKLHSNKPKSNPEEFYLWAVDNTIVPMGKFNSTSDALMEVGDVPTNWVATENDLNLMKEEALSVIENNEENMWYALYLNGDIDRLGIYQSFDQANENHPDDIIYYMNTESLNDFMIQLPIHKLPFKAPSIKASIREGFTVDAPSDKYEVEISDDEGKVISEFYNTKYEAEHRIGWITRQDTSSWDTIGNYDMGPTQQIALTADGFRSLGSFVAGSRIDYDTKGEKVPVSDDEVADVMFGDSNWAFISSEYESKQQLSALQEIINNDKFVLMDGQDPWLYEGTNEVMVFLDADTALEHAKSEDDDFDENNIISYQNFLSEYCEGSIDKHWPELRVQADIISSPDADYVALDTNGEMVPIYDVDSIEDAIKRMEAIYNDTGVSFVEIVPLDEAKLWAIDLESLLISSPEYKMEHPFGLDFDISELNPALTSQWITKINYRHPPKRLHSVSFNDEWDIVDEVDGKEYKVQVTFEDKIEVGINATTEDYYDKLLHFLETTVITRDLTAFDFTFLSSHKDNTDIYDIFLAELENMVNAQDLTAFEFNGIEVIDENPHFIVNKDFTLSCVTSSDIASEEHTHGWFDTDNNVHSLLPALKKHRKNTKIRINKLPFSQK